MMANRDYYEVLGVSRDNTDLGGCFRPDRKVGVVGHFSQARILGGI